MLEAMMWIALPGIFLTVVDCQTKLNTSASPRSSMISQVVL
jgi:hypothetical protein